MDAPKAKLLTMTVFGTAIHAITTSALNAQNDANFSHFLIIINSYSM